MRGGTVVPQTLLDYLQTRGLNLLELSLRRVVGRGTSVVTQDAQYRQTVIQPAWDVMPLPIRALIKPFTRWEEFFFGLRDAVFDLGGALVSLRPEASAVTLAHLKRHFADLDKGSNARPALAPDGVPLAQPVGPAPTSPAHPVANKDSAEIVVGIDLGTTYSLIAYVDAQGRPCSIPSAAGDLLTPSVVLFEEGGSVVGKEALAASVMEPDQVAECVKRDMGAKVYRKKINGEYLPPEVISSLILRSLKTDAERKFGRPVRQAVITVPAYFEETRRRATIDAGRLAGLQVLDIINEPTAAAIAYGYQLGFLDRSCKPAGDAPLRVLVFDLGGGTFDVTIVEIRGPDFKALATDGDVCLGGKDWDERLMALAAERFREQFREDPRDNPVSHQELSIAGEAAKRTLSERKRATLYINHMGTRLKVEVTREEFEESTAALLERTRMTTEIVARQAGLSWADIDRILLVGGSTRMPMIDRMLEDLTGKPPEHSVSVDEAVAHGAALYAEMLAPRPDKGSEAPAFSITNVNSHSLGIQGAHLKTGRKINKILIPKNSPLPRTATKVFKTAKPNQRNVAIKVLEGESDRPEVCTLIGTCAIRDLPANLPAGWPVEVSYSYEANGRLQVSARVKGHQAGVTTEFQRENGLPDDDLDLWARYAGEELRDLSEAPG
jgi:molecular chaperone DnaK